MQVRELSIAIELEALSGIEKTHYLINQMNNAGFIRYWLLPCAELDENT
jgi:hypothetical protein